MLGAMKRLEVVSGTEQTPKPKSSGRGLKNFIFVAGLGTAIVLGASSFGLHRYTNKLDPRYEREAQLENFEMAIDQISPSQLVEFYGELDVDGGLGEWYEPNYVRYGKQANYLRRLVPIGYAIAGLGLLAMVGSFFMRK